MSTWTLLHNNLEDSNAGTEAMDNQDMKLIYKVLLRSLRVVDFVGLKFTVSTTSYFVCEWIKKSFQCLNYDK